MPARRHPHGGVVILLAECREGSGALPSKHFIRGCQHTR